MIRLGSSWYYSQVLRVVWRVACASGMARGLREMSVARGLREVCVARGLREVCVARGLRGTHLMSLSIGALPFVVVLLTPRFGVVALNGIAVLGFLTVAAGPARIEGEGSHSYTISFS